jgi:hypothetical protein
MSHPGRYKEGMKQKHRQSSEDSTVKLNNTDGSDFFTPQQVARRWGWHVESIRRAIRQKRIESIIIFRRRLVPIGEVERIEAEGRIVRAA